MEVFLFVLYDLLICNKSLTDGMNKFSEPDARRHFSVQARGKVTKKVTKIGNMTKFNKKLSNA